MPTFSVRLLSIMADGRVETTMGYYSATPVIVERVRKMIANADKTFSAKPEAHVTFQGSHIVGLDSPGELLNGLGPLADAFPWLKTK